MTNDIVGLCKIFAQGGHSFYRTRMILNGKETEYEDVYAPMTQIGSEHLFLCLRFDANKKLVRFSVEEIEPEDLDDLELQEFQYGDEYHE